MEFGADPGRLGPGDTKEILLPPIPVPKGEGARIEDLVWWEADEAGFATLDDFGEGVVLVDFEGGGPRLRLRCGRDAPDPSLDVFDGERWIDTGLDAKPATPYRLRLEADLGKGAMSVYLREGSAAEAAILSGARLPAFAEGSVRRRFSASGKPRFATRVSRWEAWDVGGPGAGRPGPSGAPEFPFGLAEANPGWTGARLSGDLGLDPGPPAALRLHPPAGFPPGFPRGPSGFELHGSARMEGGRLLLGGARGAGSASRGFRLPTGPLRVEARLRLPAMARREERAFSASFGEGAGGFELVKNAFEPEVALVAPGADVTPPGPGLRRRSRVPAKDEMVGGGIEAIGGRGETRRVLTIRLPVSGGRRDHAPVARLSGAWGRAIELPAGTSFLRVKAVARLNLGREESPKESLRLHATLDGREPKEATPFEIRGGQRREPVDSGWREVSMVFPVGAGTRHELLVGAIIQREAGTPARTPSMLALASVETSTLSVEGARGVRCPSDPEGRVGIVRAAVLRRAGGGVGGALEAAYDLASDALRLWTDGSKDPPLLLSPKGGDVRAVWTAAAGGRWGLRLADGAGKTLREFGDGASAAPGGAPAAGWGGQEATLELRTVAASAAEGSARPELVLLAASAGGDASGKGPRPGSGEALSPVLDAGEGARGPAVLRASARSADGGSVALRFRASDERFAPGDADPPWRPAAAGARVAPAEAGRFFQWRAELGAAAGGPSPVLEYLVAEAEPAGGESGEPVSDEPTHTPALAAILGAALVAALAWDRLRRRGAAGGVH